jgi:DNA-binding transcriptional ArsR family regulator
MGAAEVFRALGDPVRLKMVSRLAKSRSSTIVALSQDLGLTRQGARRHLQVLVNAKLARLSKVGRDVNVELDAKTLEQAKAYIGKLERQWEIRLDALKGFVEGNERSELSNQNGPASH